MKIDDVSNIGSLKLRVRSLIESLKGVKEVISEERRVKKQCAAVEGIANSRLNTQHLQLTKAFTKQDIHRKILAPFMSEYLTPIIPPILKLIGYDVEVLPMSNEVSAELGLDRKSTRLNSSHIQKSRMPSSA